MSDKMLPELPDKIAQRAKQAGFSPETVLPAEFERDAEYPVFTPYGNEAAAETLILALEFSKFSARFRKKRFVDI